MSDSLGVATELFNPGGLHLLEEKQRLEHTRYEEGSSDPSKGAVDLDSGQIVIALTGTEAVLPPRPRLEETAPDEELVPDETEPESV